jgi:PAS domain S-box-containing protein
MTDRTYEKLYQLSRDGMMVLGEEAFLDCNPATLEMFKCASVEAFCSKHPAELSPEYQPCGGLSAELAQQQIDTALQEGYARFDWVHRRCDGETFYAEVLLSPAVWKGKEVLQAVVRDVSERKRLEIELREAKDSAEQSNRAKSEFLAIISHELRTPIHGIIGAQELLLDSELTPEQREDGVLVLHSALSLLNTVNDILDFSKIEAGKIDLERTPFSPEVIIDDVYRLLAIKAKEKALFFTLSYEGDMPAYLMGDPTKIRQILLNLCGNAIKFTQHGGIDIKSQFALTDTGDVCWTIGVSDSGIGMSSEQIKGIFDKFIQADSSTSRLYGGTGLGLAISQELAGLMGSQIAVESRISAGSTFTLSLNLPSVDASEVCQQKIIRKFERHYAKHALVAEDNPVNQRIIKKQLERIGITMVLAENGLEAIKLYQQARPLPDVILMDLQMPRLGGIEAAKRLRELGCTQPIIALTADAHKERRIDCQAAGMGHFLSKPFAINDLITVLDAIF